jgi:hypothetical protein
MAYSNDNVAISYEIWNKLEAVIGASCVIKPYQNDMIKNEDKSGFKRPMELRVADYHSFVPQKFDFFSKCSMYSINMDLLQSAQLCRLLILTTSKF